MDKQQKEERFNLLLKLVMAILFMTGAIVFSYPFVVDAINNYHDQKVIATLQKENAMRLNDEREERIAQMREKNESLIKNKKMTNIPGLGLVEDPFSTVNQKHLKEDQAYYDKHTIGAIFIPRIHVSLPLYDTTNNQLLEKGATILQGTSFPIGGADTHSVITGHSGLTDKVLFTNLEKLMVGDYFFIEVAGEKLAYEIESFNVVLPDELDDLVIEDGRDLVTLLTCTPYAVNTHRLLVKAHRIPYIEETMEREKESTLNYHANRFRLFMGLIPLFFSLILYWMWQKFVFYQSGKYTYDFTFTLISQGQPVRGRSFQLLDRHKELLLRAGAPLVAVSDADGTVCFKAIHGGKYYLLPEEDLNLPQVKGKVKRLKGKQFTLYYTFKRMQKRKVGKEVRFLLERRCS